MSKSSFSFIVFGLCSTAVPAFAQWTVENLHPTGAALSSAQSVKGNQQAGYADVGGIRRACKWTGTAASWVDLHPPGTALSIAWAQDGALQAGTVEASGTPMAALWHDFNGSWVNLHPANSNFSYVFGAQGGYQVGVAELSGTRASLWQGTAASRVSLWGAGSQAFAVDNGRQVGHVTFATRRASMWRGTVDSMILLHPITATSSIAVGIHGSQQVGMAVIGGAEHAGLWNGTAESWVDLNPPGSTESRASGVNGCVQVGYAMVSGVAHAALWTGSRSSWTDLHSLLPVAFTSSNATGTWSDHEFTYVSGDGFNSLAGRNEALLWKRPSLLCPADIAVDDDGNRDCGVDINDLLYFLVGFEAGSSTVDLDNDGDPAIGTPDGGVDVSDLLFFLAHFEAGC